MNNLRLGSIAAFEEIPYDNLVFFASTDYPLGNDYSGPTFSYVYATAGSDITIQRNRFYLKAFLGGNSIESRWNTRTDQLKNIIGGTMYFVRFDDPINGVTDGGVIGATLFYGGTGKNYYTFSSFPEGILSLDDSKNVVYSGNSSGMGQISIQFPNSIANDDYSGIYGFVQKAQIFGTTFATIPLTLTANGGFDGSTFGGSTSAMSYGYFLYDYIDYAQSNKYNSSQLYAVGFQSSTGVGCTFYDGFTFYEVSETALESNRTYVSAPVVTGNSYWFYEGVTTGFTYSGGITSTDTYFGKTAGFLKIKNIPFTVPCTVCAWMELNTDFFGSTGINSGTNIVPNLCGVLKNPAKIFYRTWPLSTFGRFFSIGDQTYTANYNLDGSLSNAAIRTTTFLPNEKKIWCLICNQITLNPIGFYEGFSQYYFANSSKTLFGGGGGLGSTANVGILGTGFFDLNFGVHYGMDINKFFENKVGMVAVYHDAAINSGTTRRIYEATLGRFESKI